MRMHSYGKCSPNLAAGALTIFVLIVLYNYWNVSTLNRDLSIKLHSLEQQVVTFSRANDGLSSNLEKAQDEKTNLQNSLIKEEAEEKASRDLVSQKDKLIKDLQNDLENTKQEAQNCLHESSSQDNKLQLKEKEITELKEKVVSLEAQVVEKTSQNEKIEMELSDAKDKIENLQKLASNKPTAASSKSTAASVGAKPVVSPDEQQAVLLNDPAVPYPDGWMKPHYSVNRADPKVDVKDIPVGLKGMKHYRGLPIIIQDPRDSPRKQARFSVLNPPKHGDQFRPYNGYQQQLHRGNNDGPLFEIQMNPAASKDPKMPEPLKQPSGIEDMGPSGKDNGEEVGVLPVPGQLNQVQSNNNKEAPQVPLPPQGGNLDAAEDDGDRQVKEDQALQDDQSPDGALPKENIVAVVPAPNIKPDGIPAPAHSGQDAREDAHLMHGNNL